MRWMVDRMKVLLAAFDMQKFANSCLRAVL